MRRIETEDGDEIVECDCKPSTLVDFMREQPFWAFLIASGICYAIVEIVAIIVLKHPITINF